MGDETQPLSPGDRWQPVASVFNGYQEAADYVRELKTGGGAIPGTGVETNACVITVKNQSGADCNRFDVLGIDQPIFSPDDNLSAFKNRDAVAAVTPSVATHRGRWVVLLKPLADGAVGPAVAAGIVKTRIYVHSPDDPYCDVIDAKTFCNETVYLGTGNSGAEILWKERCVGGIVWAILRLGGANQDAAFVATPTTAAPTTTTPFHPSAAGCVGQCRFLWSAANKSWTLDRNDCNTATTTLRPTTTTTPCPDCEWVWNDTVQAWYIHRDNRCDQCGKVCYPPDYIGYLGEIRYAPCIHATTTTSPPCLCSDPHGNTTTTPSPTTSTSTTTTSAPCQCAWPSFCGEEDGECTATNCISNLFQVTPPQCGQTTPSPTTPSPTTTTMRPGCYCVGDVYVCDGTTSPPPPTTANPCSGCDWERCTTGWVPKRDGCALCPRSCPPPSDTGEACFASTGCTEERPTTQPPRVSCDGVCSWVGECGGYWRLESYSCTGSGSCGCPPPSGQPDCHARTTTKCETYTAPTPTTAAPTTTTTFNPCTTTTTTGTTSTTTSSTTTTPSPCNKTCKWGWDDAWILKDNPCTPSCPCLEPYYRGTDLCEVAWTPCQTTTTSTTTTTTTTCSPPGTAVWIRENSNGRVAWGLYDNRCCPGYWPCAPVAGGSVDSFVTTMCMSTLDQCPTTPAPPCSGCGYLCQNAAWVLAYSHCQSGCPCPRPPSGKCFSGSKLTYPCL